MTAKRVISCSALVVLLVASLVWHQTARGDEPRIAEALAQRILDENLPLEEVQRFTESRVARMPVASTVDAWNQTAAKLRRQVLDEVVFRGEAGRWRDAATKVEWLDTLPGGPGYHLRKVRYEALPGLWIPAILYEPDTLVSQVPVVLNVNGHDERGKALPYKQIRCINQAKRGMLALNVDWVGMGQLHTKNSVHYRMNQLDLCGTSGVAVHYLALKRGLDLLLAHPHADPQRVAVTGLSGGGWQTIFISSLDTRVTLANPVAGYSSFLTRARFVSDLGDSEQTPVDLASIADYTHLTAMRAPRPTLLTYNALDDCCFRADHALQPLLDAALPIFALYGKADGLRSHINEQPGTHNFERDNRETLYRMLGDFFSDDPKAFDAKELPCDAEVKSADELSVPLPADNADFHTLALRLSARLPRPATQPTENTFDRREALRKLVRIRLYPVKAEEHAQQPRDKLQIVHWRLKLGEDWTLPATESAPPAAASTTLLIADTGRKNAADAMSRLLASGQRVLAVDPFYFGESRISQRDHLFALLVSSVGERPLGVQAGQVASIARWIRSQHPNEKITLMAIGPRTCTIGMIAAAVEVDAINRLEMFEPLPSLKAVIERNWAADQYPELFCFGLLEQFDVRDFLTLVAPREVAIHDSEARAAFPASASSSP